MATNNPPEITQSTKKEIDKMQLTVDQISRGVSILNANQIQKIFNSTPERYKYVRDGKAGQKWTYVKKSYVRKVLDGVFGFNWDFKSKTPVLEALQVAQMTGSVVVEGSLVCRVLDERKQVVAEIVKEDYGSAPVKFEMVGTGSGRRKKVDENGKPVLLDFGNDVKAARSDCLKRCAAQFGVAADIYEKEEFIQFEVIGSDEQSDSTKKAKDRVKKAAKALDAESTKVGKQNGGKK